MINTHPHQKNFEWLGAKHIQIVLRAKIFGYLVFLKQKIGPIKINYFFLVKKSISHSHVGFKHSFMLKEEGEYIDEGHVSKFYFVVMQYHFDVPDHPQDPH